VVAAAERARALGISVVGFGGCDGGELRSLSDAYVHVPADDYGLIESAHLVFDHCLTSMLAIARKDEAVHASARPAVFLDRDGVIVRNSDSYIKSLDELDFLPGSIDAIALLHRHGFRVFVVTNQSAVGRGLLRPEDLEAIHSHIRAEVVRHGADIEAFFVCPHHPRDGCDCRKPKPGLLHKARDSFDVDLSLAVMVGDHESDLIAAAAVGCRAVLVTSGRTVSDEVHPVASAVVEDLIEAARLIIHDQVAAGSQRQTLLGTSHAVSRPHL
jgi:D-glycero-D-manno-heptose 1,7-bisphosphate phosphatase